MKRPGIPVGSATLAWFLSVCLPIMTMADEPSNRSTRSLTLDEAVSIAFKQSPTLRAQRAEVEEAKAHLVGAKTYPFNPDLEFSMASRKGGGSSSKDLAVALSQELEIAGQGGNRAKAAEKDLAAALARFQRNQRILASQVHVAFVNALEAKDFVNIGQANTKLVTVLQELAQRRFRTGAASKLEANLAKIEVGRAQARLHQATGVYLETQALLAEVIGLGSESFPTPVGQLPKTFEPSVSLTELLQNGSKRRADLVAMKHFARAAQDRLRLAQSESFPNLTLQAFGEREGGTETIIGGGVSIPIPLFNRNQGGRAEAQAQEQKASAEVEATKLSVSREIKSVHAQYEAARVALESLQTNVLGTVQENLKVLQRMFEKGKTSWTEVLVIRRSLIEARQELIETAAQAERLRVLLDLASGRTSFPKHIDKGVAR